MERDTDLKRLTERLKKAALDGASEDRLRAMMSEYPMTTEERQSMETFCLMVRQAVR